LFSTFSAQSAISRRSKNLRAYDTSNPYQPAEIAYFVPQVANAPTGACQINDVFVDDRGIVFCVDRHVGGLYALEMDF